VFDEDGALRTYITSLFWFAAMFGLVATLNSLGEILYLSRADVEKLDIPIGDVIHVVEAAFREQARGSVEMPPKPGIHPQPDAFIHAMPAYIPIMQSAGIKWVSGFPGNPQHGLPYIAGLLVLNNPETGIPTCVMDGTWITAKRTGAATAIAAKYLAREDARSVGILGCGVQGRSNIEALTLVCKNLEQVKAYDIDRNTLQTYAEEITTTLGINVSTASAPRKAVEASDIVVTAGPILKHPHPVIEAAWFKDGGFACPLDFDSYWRRDALYSMDKFLTDDEPQLAYYKTQGYFIDTPPIYAELSEIVSGIRPGRENGEERIMSMNLGLAIEDMATAMLVYEKAQSRGLGRELPL
jgi:ornithine cyclodeaminase/alanine dehydrogenase-like protein (mu-crystallin family)